MVFELENCPRCGKEPRFVTEVVNDVSYGWVQCDCGVRTNAQEVNHICDEFTLSQIWNSFCTFPVGVSK